MRVSTFVVRTQPFAETVNATGTVLADESVELQAEITGKIIAIHFKEGARVRAGDLLVKLNDADLRATLGRAAYRKELATLRERRISQLLKQGVARQEEYDTALSELNIQDAEIQLARAQIAKTEIRAPFDGVVGLRYVSEGAYVNSATRIAALQRLDNIKIDFALPERYVGRIKVGSTVSFAVAGVAARGKAEIYALDPRIDAGTRMLLIRAISRNPNGALLPGTFANVEVSLDELANAVLIPSEAVIPGVDEKNVFVLVDGKARRREVTTGTRTASSIHILKGLDPTDVVITSGLQQMREGQAVVAIEAQAPATGPPGSAEPSVAAAARL
jgi:membrane fusion protein (multidrug efflux system)